MKNDEDLLSETGLRKAPEGAQNRPRRGVPREAAAWFRHLKTAATVRAIGKGQSPESFELTAPEGPEAQHGASQGRTAGEGQGTVPEVRFFAGAFVAWRL